MCRILARFEDQIGTRQALSCSENVLASQITLRSMVLGRRETHRSWGALYITLILHFSIPYILFVSVLGRLSPVPKMCLPASILRASRNPPVARYNYTTLLLHFSISYILSVYLFISLSVYISVCQYIYLVSVYLSIHLSIYLVSLCLSLYLFACLHLHQSVMIL